MAISIAPLGDGSFVLHSDGRAIHIGEAGVMIDPAVSPSPAPQPPVLPSTPSEPRRRPKPIIITGPFPHPRPTTSISITPTVPSKQRRRTNAWLDLSTDLQDGFLSEDAVQRLRDMGKLKTNPRGYLVTAILHPHAAVDIDSLAAHVEDAVGTRRPLHLHLAGRVVED